MTDATDLLDPDDPTPDDDAPIAESTLDQSLRYSVLKCMAKSPAHARDAMLRQGDGASLALRLGSATHAMTFGDRPVVVYPGKQRRGKEWDEFAAANAHAVIVNAKEYAQARGMADSIRSHPVAARVLLAPEVIRERRIDWTWNGRAWRSTPDAYHFRTLAELKTTRCADPARFWRDALNMAYHCQLALYQLALYRRAILETTGVRVRDVYLFAVESVRPYVVTPFMLSERSLDHGDMLARRWHERFLECEAKNDWPGYTPGVADLDIYDPEDEATFEVERAMANDDGVRKSVVF